ncbi:MAG: hypothetical protein GX028_00030 [Clostridiaceae bacterium]|nr:hypothetical protein [Clostridiaceae bacterium]
MALSLEAAITVPICIVATCFTLNLTFPVYKQSEIAAGLSAETVKASCANKHIYASKIVEYRGLYTSVVSVSPDGVIDVYRLGKDLMRPLGDVFQGGDTEEESDD